jgi:hypothetical protein
MSDIAARQIGRPSKPITLKPKSQHRHKARPIQNKEKFNSEWDRIFGKPKAE